MRIAIVHGGLTARDRGTLQQLVVHSPHCLEVVELDDKREWEPALRRAEWVVILAQATENDGALAVFRAAVVLGRQASVMRALDELRLHSLLNALQAREAYVRRREGKSRNSA